MSGEPLLKVKDLKKHFAVRGGVLVDGSGAARLHFGLLGMQERAALVGGSVQIESAAGAGTTIYVQIPCP